MIFLNFISINLPCLVHFLLDRNRELQRTELPPVCLEKLILELHPLQTQSVQKALHRVHTHYHPQRYVEKQVHPYHYYQYVPRLYPPSYRLLQKHPGELSVGQRQCPQTQVRCRVRDASQHKLDCLNDLMNRYLADVFFMIVLLSTAVEGCRF